MGGVGPVPVETMRRLLGEGDVCRVATSGPSVRSLLPAQGGVEVPLSRENRRVAVLPAQGEVEVPLSRENRGVAVLPAQGGVEVPRSRENRRVAVLPAQGGVEVP